MAKLKPLATLHLQAMTKNIHVSTATLLAEISQVRKNGYALDQEEFMDDMVAIAVPVTDPKKSLYCGACLPWSKARVNIPDAIKSKELLQLAARRISESLFA